MLVSSDLKTDARKGHFWNGCTQGSCGTRMRATRKAIAMVARVPGPPRYDDDNVSTLFPLFHDRSCCTKYPAVPNTLSWGLAEGAPSTGCQVGCISILYALWGCIPPRIKVAKNMCDLFSPSCAEINAHATSAQWPRNRGSKREDEDTTFAGYWCHHHAAPQTGQTSYAKPAPLFSSTNRPYHVRVGSVRLCYSETMDLPSSIY